MVWLGRPSKSYRYNEFGARFCITSIKDLTSTVTLKPYLMAYLICLDHCGFSHVVNDSCGIKINSSTPKKATLDFSGALE